MPHLQPIPGPAAWLANDLADDWRLSLDDSDRQCLRDAVELSRRGGKHLFDVQRDDFPLATLGERLAALTAELEGGRGFKVLSGLPVQPADDDFNALLLWGIGRYLGEAEPQDKAGNLLHRIEDTGQSVENTADIRGFQTSSELEFHTDGADIFALMCVRQAPSGGGSRLVSSTSVFNALVERYPQDAAVLQQPFHFDARAQSPWEKQIQSLPVFICHDGRVSGLYKRRYIETAQRFDDVPRLSPAQRQALDRLDQVAAELALEFRLAPGDLVLANNYSCFHARGAYQDGPTDAERRLNLRLWLTLPNGRPLPAEYADTREWGLTYRRRLHQAA